MKAVGWASNLDIGRSLAGLDQIKGGRSGSELISEAVGPIGLVKNFRKTDD